MSVDVELGFAFGSHSQAKVTRVDSDILFAPDQRVKTMSSENQNWKLLSNIASEGDRLCSSS